MRAAASRLKWRKDFCERVYRLFEVSEEWGYEEARLATLEAIYRACRKKGWEVSYTSGKSRASSRYIRVTGAGMVRVSDHDLPLTRQREYEWDLRGGPSWSGEVVIYKEWLKCSLTRYLRRLLLEAHGRCSLKYR